MSLLELVKEEQRRKAVCEPEPVPRVSFVGRTGQAKRLTTARWVSIAGGLALFAGWATASRPYGMSLILGGTVVGIFGFVWQCLSVRCPQCRVAVVWYTFNTRKHSEADAAALYQLVCPKCGYDPP